MLIFTLNGWNRQFVLALIVLQKVSATNHHRKKQFWPCLKLLTMLIKDVPALECRPIVLTLAATLYDFFLSSFPHILTPNLWRPGVRFWQLRNVYGTCTSDRKWLQNVILCSKLLTGELIVHTTLQNSALTKKNIKFNFCHVPKLSIGFKYIRQSCQPLRKIRNCYEFQTALRNYECVLNNYEFERE